jgi:hypothetical protein
MIRSHRAILLLLLSLTVVFTFTGCASTDDTDNETSRPWNAPRSWETGLPGFQQDRR